MIVTPGHPAFPVLRHPARPVGDRLDDPAWSMLAGGMRLSMAASRGVGIAAPQVGMSSRLAVLADGTVLVDPEIIERSGEDHESVEGCLSLPGEQHVVRRARRVVFRYRDLDGRAHEETASGFEAAVVQHEVDHLDGVLIDRVR